jgi:hypothetical protein
MRMERIFLAAILGAIVVFVWGFVSHTVLPVGEMGMKTLPQPAPVMASLKGLTERGVYSLPPMPTDDSHQAQAQWQAEWKAGPRAMIVYDPPGPAPGMPVMLAIEFASSLIGALIISFVSSRLVTPYLVRVIAIGALGAFAWAAIDASYWNWYRFPTAFALGELIDQVVGWTLAGIVIAAIARPARMSMVVAKSSEEP